MRGVCLVVVSATLLVGSSVGEPPDDQEELVAIRVFSGEFSAVQRYPDAKAVNVALDRVQTARLRRAGKEIDKRLQRNLGVLRAVFWTRWGDLVGTARVPVNKQTVWVAKWRGQEGYPTVKEAILWDAPEHKLFIMKLDPGVLRSAAQLKNLLEKAVRIPSMYIHIRRASVGVSRSAIGTGGKPKRLDSVVGLGSVGYEESPPNPSVEKGFEFDLTIVTRKGNVYIGFRLGNELWESIAYQEAQALKRD